MRKLSEEQKEEICKMITQGRNYDEIVKYIEDKYKITITKVAISKVKTRFLKLFRPSQMSQIAAIAKADDKKMYKDIQHTMQNCIEICSKASDELKIKSDIGDMKSIDYKTLSMIMDKATLIWRLTRPEETKEQTFINTATKEYSTEDKNEKNNME